jgi:phenylalanyl-tRNA synthetase beta chain
MPTITFPKEVFMKALGRKMNDVVLAEKLALLGTDVQAITEDEIVVEVFPDRPDMLSLQGFIRAFRSFLGSKKGLADFKVKKGKEIVFVDSALKPIRPFTACAIARRLKLDDARIKQIIDLQEKLHGTYGRKRKRIAMGVYPLDKITFPVRFEAREPGDITFTPLDMDKPLPALQILKEHPKGKEYEHLLFNCRYFPVFVDDEENILSLVPIVNSEHTGKVTPDTKEVFIEVSGFDFEVCHKALLMVCAALNEMGATIETVELRYEQKKIYSPDFTPKSMKLSAKAVNELLGTSLSQTEVNEALMKMGYEAKGINVKVPAYRTDILHEVDLIEDVAIGYGYEKLQPTLPLIGTIGAESEHARTERVVRSLFVSLGYTEVKNFCLSSIETQVDRVKQMRRPLEMENPLSEEYNVLRQQLIPGLLETLAKNRSNEYPQYFFELGPVWTPEEEPRLAFVICGEKAGFTEAKATLEAAFKLLGKELPLKPYEEKIFISGRAAVFPGGFFGEIHPEVLEAFDIGFAVAAGEIRLREILE